MRRFDIGDKIRCYESGVRGICVKFYTPTACEEQTIVEQPTVFDAEKVIEEFENLREVELHTVDMFDELGNGDGESQYNDGVSQGRYEAFIEAIEIVERGGRDGEK